MDAAGLLVRIMLVQLVALPLALGAEFYERPGISATEIIRARGYHVEEVYLVTKDGYQLQLIHAWSPLQNSSRTTKVPILFVHGLMAQANNFVLNSFGAKPRDFGSLDLSDENVIEQVAQDPSAKSLPLLAMNFGHEVWLLNRRGAPGSQTKIGGLSEKILKQMRALNISMDANKLDPRASSALTALFQGGLTSPLTSYGQFLQLVAISADADFWKFSMDEQVDHDFPMVVEYVRDRNNGSKIAVVAHSEGGAITLMALCEKPELADSISSAILWAPALNLGHSSNEFINNIVPIRSLLETYVGPVPPPFVTAPSEAALGLLCSSNLGQRTVCKAFHNSFYGDGGDNEPLLPEFTSSNFYPSSSHEIAQFAQCAGKFGGNMHKYDYGLGSINQAKYNQLEPPAYETSRIRLEHISLYVGREDKTVAREDVEYSSSILTAQHKFHLIDTKFSHVGYFFHNETVKLSIVPSLQEIRKFSAEDGYR